MVAVALAVIAYVPALWLPFISDDFVQIPLAQKYALAGWAPLWHDPNLGSRATYMWLSAWLATLFGPNPVPFYAVGILLHVACVLCIYAMSGRTQISQPVAFYAACFFAVYEGHCEAVMWLAASSELLVFLFGLISWLCWVQWLDSGSWRWYAVSLLTLGAAALSKESFWIFPALFMVTTFAGWAFSRRWVIGILPFCFISVSYVCWSYLDRVSRPGYSDIRFSLDAPWPLVVINSSWRLLFIWGLLALIILFVYRKNGDGKRMLPWLLWIVISIFPYSFLTYMLRVPSRHTYIASLGLAILCGMAAQRLAETKKKMLLLCLAAFALLTNIEIIWVKKMAQFRERAEPSELLRQAAAKSAGPIYVDCSPLAQVVVDAILESVGKRAIYSTTPRKADGHCFSISYNDQSGHLVTLQRPMDTAKHSAFQ